jgi:septation ring formation regulator EzrA
MQINLTWIIITIIGWIVLGITIPLVAHFWKKMDKRIDFLEAWKSSLKGDLMTKEQHIEYCETVQNETFGKFCKKIDDIMNSHKTWLEERLRRLESDMKLYVERAKTYGKEDKTE